MSEEPRKKKMDQLLRPRSIAIVGASPNPGSFGMSVLRNLEEFGYAGELHLINPKRTTIGERACLPSVDELPEGVDCAVLAIPGAGVLPTLEACARRGIGAAIIFSAGFAESGDVGRIEQHKIRAIAHASGMIVEGPNCLGMVNFVDGVPLTFVAVPPGRCAAAKGVATVSQSGAMAAVLGVSLRDRELDMSYSISTGNEAAYGVEDFIEHLVDDPNTRVFAMIVEQFRSPRRFLRLAERVRGAGKQIVLLHPGRSSAARASATTHTGAMAGNYEVMRTAVRHAGVLMVETTEELVDVADILIRCAPMAQGGAAVFTESGAFKAMALDFCDGLGLALPSLSEGTANALRAVLPEFIVPSNPLDITAQGLVDPEMYRRALPPVLSDEHYGSVLLSIILTDRGTSGLKLPPILKAIEEIRPSKPVLFAGMDAGAEIDAKYVEALRRLGVPFFPSPERALRALALVTSFAERSESREEVAGGTAGCGPMLSQGVMPEYRSKQILAAAGIAIPAGRLAKTEEEAERIAEEIGYPVVLKAQSREISHKSDVGGVALDLRDEAALRAGWTKMVNDLARAMPEVALDGLMVEKMGAAGVELIVGARNDPEWGPVLLIGFGGVLAEALHDVRLIPANLSAAAIKKELLQLKSAALLREFRGAPELDVDAVVAIVERVGTLVRQNPSIREIDINPVIAYPKGRGAMALDALIVVD